MIIGRRWRIISTLNSFQTCKKWSHRGKKPRVKSFPGTKKGFYFCCFMSVLVSKPLGWYHARSSGSPGLFYEKISSLSGASDGKKAIAAHE